MMANAVAAALRLKPGDVMTTLLVKVAAFKTNLTFAVDDFSRPCG